MEGWEGGIAKEHQESLGDGGYAHGLDSGDGFTGVYICQNLLACTL